MGKKSFIIGVLILALSIVNVPLQCFAAEDIQLERSDSVGGVFIKYIEGYNDKRFWVSASASDYCDFSISGTVYYGADGVSINFSKSQTTYCDYGSSAPEKITGMSVHFIGYTNNDYVYDTWLNLI